MTDPSQARSDQTVDPAIVEWASVFTYWALIGLAAILGVLPVETSVALALAPIALLSIEAVARRVAARLVS